MGEEYPDERPSDVSPGSDHGLIAPIRHDEGILMGSFPYAHPAEAMKVGDAFPEHDIYERLTMGWLDEFDERNKNPGAAGARSIGRYALLGVYLFTSEMHVPDLKTYPTYDDSRLTDMGNGGVRYVFAEGTSDEPLLEETYQPEVPHHGDLPAPDYDRLVALVGEQPGLKVEYVQERVQELAAAHVLPPTATAEDLSFVRSVVSAVADEEVSCLPEGSPRDALKRELFEDMMNQIFSGAYSRE